MDQIICNVEVQQKVFENLLVGIVSEKAVLDILQICDQGKFRSDFFKVFGELKLTLKHVM